MEEWGFNLGEDACLLFEDDSDFKGPDINNNVDVLVDKLVEEEMLSMKHVEDIHQINIIQENSLNTDSACKVSNQPGHQGGQQLEVP